MDKFDYAAPADVFPARTRVGRRPIGYRRFDTAAEAIRYVVEQMPEEFVNGTVMETENERYDGPSIKLLYVSDLYPLARK